MTLRGERSPYGVAGSPEDGEGHARSFAAVRPEQAAGSVACRVLVELVGHDGDPRGGQGVLQLDSGGQADHARSQHTDPHHRLHTEN